uniref:Uncharacterized protein n=2 Tax=Globodera rostochiensis TaxID=31243 RepID=A0A914I319_GLORO
MMKKKVIGPTGNMASFIELIPAMLRALFNGAREQWRRRRAGERAVQTRSPLPARAQACPPARNGRAPAPPMVADQALPLEEMPPEDAALMDVLKMNITRKQNEQFNNTKKIYYSFQIIN